MEYLHRSLLLIESTVGVLCIDLCCLKLRIEISLLKVGFTFSVEI
jgi:hypothetical protein